MNEIHKPVLLQEAIEALNIIPNERYIDGTVGAGGHSCEILRNGGVVLGIDMDPEILKIARQKLERCGKEILNPTVQDQDDRGTKDRRFILIQGNFANLKEIADQNDFTEVSGILLDLGLSSFQLDSARGFSFKRDEPLDMRMDPSLGVTAADLVNGLNEGELYELFTRLGEEPFARRIAHRIVTSRLNKKIETTGELAALVEQAVGFRARGTRLHRGFGGQGKIHPATKVFQALRIAVNDELNNLRAALPQTLALLRPGGRVVIISFHSLEDRIVKQFFREEAAKGEIRILTDKPLVPSEEEIRENPRARSAKMRVGEKTE